MLDRRNTSPRSFTPKLKLRATISRMVLFSIKRILQILNKSTSTLTNHQSQTNSHLQRRINTLEISQSNNYTIAGLKLSMRRTDSGLKRHWRLIKNGHDDSLFKITFDWLVDHLLYLWDILWGIVGPILTMFLIVIVQLIVTLVATVCVIYAVYAFITL